MYFFKIDIEWNLYTLEFVNLIKSLNSETCKNMSKKFNAKVLSLLCWIYSSIVCYLIYVENIESQAITYNISRQTIEVYTVQCTHNILPNSVHHVTIH